MRSSLTAVVVAAAISVASLALPKAAKGGESTSKNRRIICQTFGSYCQQALRVSFCESRHHTWARNGQYLGLFQMGSNERRIYGHGDSALAQAQAAWRYFVASGRDWSPWSCKP